MISGLDDIGQLVASGACTRSCKLALVGRNHTLHWRLALRCVLRISLEAARSLRPPEDTECRAHGHFMNFRARRAGVMSAQTVQPAPSFAAAITAVILC